MLRAPSLRQIELGAPRAAWAALGFTTTEAGCRIGDVTCAFAGDLGGLHGWTLAGKGEVRELDGLPTAWTVEAATRAAPPHPNGASRLDHVVLLTDALERTTGTLAQVGLEVRRVREAGAGRRQAFLWLGRRQLVLEVVQSPDAPAGRASLWGVTVVVDDLDATAARLGPALGPIRDAVQPGRRIATVRADAGLGVPVALMTPHRRVAP